MKEQAAQTCREIERWMRRSARPLEMARWAHAMGRASAGDVLLSLAAFQNPDGGFGHALEPDCFNPGSSPLQTWTACTILESVGAAPDHPVVQGVLDYLRDGPEFTGRVWRSTVPSNNDHPRAPWWSWESDEASEAEWGYNPSAALAGYVLLWADEQDPVRDRAVRVARDAMADALRNGVVRNRHLTACHRTLTEAVTQLRRDGRDGGLFPDADAFARRVRDNVSVSIDRDTSRWFVSYATLPTDLIRSPEDELYTAERAAVDTALTAIEQTRKPEDVWDISWTWSDFPEAFAVSRLWWRGVIAVENTRLLQSFGRLPAGPGTTA